MSLRSRSISICAAWLLFVGGELEAQGVTGGTISGRVVGIGGQDVDGASVVARNVSTGATWRGEVRNGAFLLSGVDLGGPYVLVVARLGFRPDTVAGLVLALGEPVRLNVTLEALGHTLDTTFVRGSSGISVEQEGGGLTRISDSLLHRLPTLNRNMYDFVALVPQVSTRIGIAGGGLSAAGAGFRYNSFLVDGVPQRSIGGHVPPEFAGARSVPLEAVREYQVLVSPFDVRFGDFAGATVNAVTRSGTNEHHGSIFGSGRNDRLARRAGGAQPLPYDRTHYGVSAGGPISRNKVHYFAAAELQEFHSPAPGPYLGQPPASARPVPVHEGDLARMAAILRQHGLVAGSAGPIMQSNPLASGFLRVDAALPLADSRLSLWVTESRSRNTAFSRLAPDTFALGSTVAPVVTQVRNAAVQLRTALAGSLRVENELVVSWRYAGSAQRAAVHQPVVRVAVPGTEGGTVIIVAGTNPLAQGGRLGGAAWNVRDDVAIPLGGRIVASAGLELERFRAERSGVANSYGTWDFTSLDALEQGTPDRYEIRRDFGSASVPMIGTQAAIHAGAVVRISERFRMNVGTRADWLGISGNAPYNAAVDSVFGRRTDESPRGHAQLSPRVGFTWDVDARGTRRLSGGAGVFTARPPGAWIHASLSSYGVGIGVLRCGGLISDRGPAPAFVTDYRQAPTACADGAALDEAPAGDVELLHPQLRLARSLRATLAYHHALGRFTAATLEATLTRSPNDYAFVNLNLAGPQGVDRQGRVMYGTISATGIAAPVRRSGFGQEVFELQNVSGGRATQLSARFDRRFSNGHAAVASYTFSRVRDVQTPLRVYAGGLLNWGTRAESGRHEDLAAGISHNDIPHRIIAAGSVRAPWKRWRTELSVYFVGESGGPLTYVARGAARGRGDLNADGSNTNDPIYIPRDAFDETEIRFVAFTRTTAAAGAVTVDTVTAAQQAASFERFVSGRRCLRGQRGRIMERNSCRQPWTNTTAASVRQAIHIGSRSIEAQADIHNVLNLLNPRWGSTRTSTAGILEHVGQTGADPASAQPIFRFDERAAGWSHVQNLSTFQLQFGLRYAF